MDADATVSLAEIMAMADTTFPRHGRTSATESRGRASRLEIPCSLMGEGSPGHHLDGITEDSREFLSVITETLLI